MTNHAPKLPSLMAGLMLFSLGVASAVMMGGFQDASEDTAPIALAMNAPSGSSPNWPSPVAAPAEGNAFVHAAAASVDAVVHVQTASLVADQSNPWLSMLGMPTARIAQGSGSGVLIDASGILVTNHHVIQGAREVRVNTSNGDSYPAKVIGSDPSTDLAVLEIEADRSFPAIAMGNSDDVQVGEWVLAVGNPLNLTSTVTAGIVSAKGRNIRLLEADASRDIYPVESFLQTDAAVNPGNSGGALVNLDGELIGINTAIASQTGSFAGYSFAIPSAIVSKVVEDLREFGRVQRAYLGIQVSGRENGVVVASTSAGGGAREAGIVEGDRILAINGIDVGSFPSLQEQLSKHRPGDQVNVTIQRDNITQHLRVTLTNRNGEVRTPSASMTSSQPLDLDGLQRAWGVTLGRVPDHIRQTLGIRGGLMVEYIRDGEWHRQGLRRGFILLRLDGQPVSAVEDLVRAVDQAARSGEGGLLLEGMYADGSRAYAGVAVPEVRP